ncbi:hypothetical protein DV515_00004683 [Chloebia gouldiae]|uniref:Uncharacterized protein n=1 Tax=Chloebia gouldiae TaxID=44316 RepID=A0A3L8SPH1_CHLGU|nr:hypothetical protein DV515_00004683 [Chloebia gouldiae]
MGTTRKPFQKCCVVFGELGSSCSTDFQRFQLSEERAVGSGKSCEGGEARVL